MLTEFLKWRVQCPEPVPRCLPDDQAKAIDILELCHHVMFDNLVDVFDLKNADREKLVAMIKRLKDDFRITDVIILISLIM